MSNLTAASNYPTAQFQTLFRLNNKSYFIVIQGDTRYWDHWCEMLKQHFKNVADREFGPGNIAELRNQEIIVTKHRLGIGFHEVDYYVDLTNQAMMDTRGT